jgi:hypothetical protein
MKTIGTIFGSIISFLGIAFCIFILGVFICGAITTEEVETYTIEATITDKDIIDEYRQSREYLLFWVNGEEAGELEVGSKTYAKYAVGDLIPIKVTVKESCFGTQNFYEYGVDK